jgi:hypothetical protein
VLPYVSLSALPGPRLALVAPGVGGRDALETVSGATMSRRRRLARRSPSILHLASIIDAAFLPALEPDFSTPDRSADCAEDPQNDADHHEDSANRVQNRKTGEVSNYEKDDAKHDHGQSDPVRRYFGTDVWVIARYVTTQTFCQACIQHLARLRTHLLTRIAR